eukprot:SAG25_NODE_366_length_9120_cov_2.274138_8_plen_63_part_00
MQFSQRPLPSNPHAGPGIARLRHARCWPRRAELSELSEHGGRGGANTRKKYDDTIVESIVPV